MWMEDFQYSVECKIDVARIKTLIQIKRFTDNDSKLLPLRINAYFHFPSPLGEGARLRRADEAEGWGEAI